MVFVRSPCSRGTSRAQLVAFANGSVYPVPPLVVVVDPLPAKSSGSVRVISMDGIGHELTLVGHSSDETASKVVSKLLCVVYEDYLQFGAVCLVEELGALSIWESSSVTISVGKLFGKGYLDHNWVKLSGS